MPSATQPDSEQEVRQRCRERVEALVSKDVRASRGEYLFAMPACLGLQGLIDDERDLPALYLICNLLLTTVPAAALMLRGCHSHWVGLTYLAVNYALYLQRFMLTCHVTHHRRLFKPGFDWLNWLLPCVLCPLFGVPPGTYRTHHVVMHHVGDNKRGIDCSSTELFQRDNIAHWLLYWVRFWLGAWFELPWFAATHKRYDVLVSTLSGEALYWLVIAWLWQYNPVGTLWVFLVPFGVSTFALMLGNWSQHIVRRKSWLRSQHIFVDPDSPHDTYRSTYNCIACPDNRLTYNDGYHIIHHINSKTHWSDMPHVFLEKLDEHDSRDALVFHSLGFFDIGVAVFTGRLGYLADHIVPCGPRQVTRTREEWIALLKRRLRPVPPRQHETDVQPLKQPVVQAVEHSGSQAARQTEHEIAEVQVARRTRHRKA